VPQCVTVLIVFIHPAKGRILRNPFVAIIQLMDDAMFDCPRFEARFCWLKPNGNSKKN
jgi:hypothetical protein